MKMTICHLCLRTDRKVHIVDKKLDDLLDDLCDFASVELTQSCAECEWMLKKFYNFRKRCILAVHVFNNWKKKRKGEKNLLYTMLPQSGLGLCNKENCKVFIYKEAELTTAPPVNVTPSNPCLVIDPSKLGIFSNNYKNNTDIFNDEILENAVKKNNSKILTDDFKNEVLQYDCIDEIKCESEEYGEDSGTVQISEEFNMIIEDCGSEVKDDDDLIDDAEYLDLELLHDAEYLDASLLQVDNVMITKENCDSTKDDNTVPIQALNDFEEVIIEENYNNTQKHKSVNNGTEMKCIIVNQTKNMASPERELRKIHSEIIQKKFEKKLVRPIHQSKIQSLRDMLKRKFDNNSELKDEKGNVIDKNVILDCLDKLPLKLLMRITSCVAGSKTFNTADLNFFSRLQNRYQTEYERVFTSEELLTDEQILKEFSKRQHHESYIGSKYKCTTCYRGFKYQKMLDYHLRTFHDKSAPLECLLCKMRFRSKIAIYRHKKAHELMLKCKLCPFTTSYRSSMINHFHFHKGVTYTCQICSKTYTSISALRTHKQNRHSSDVFCGSCGKSFVSPAGLNYHRRLKHRDEVTDPADSVKCQTCDVTFVSKEVLEVHMSKAHEGTILKRRRRNNRSGRATGSATGRATKSYVCRLCQSAGPHVGWLNKHFRFEHPNISLEEAYWMGKKYLCHICGKTFGNVTKLDEHKALHTGAKPYSCPQCHRSYRSSYALKSHSAVHLPKARQCDVCGKKFRSFSNLNCHRRIHSSERSYKCENCPATFLFKSALKEHVVGVHQNIGRIRVKKKKELETARVNIETEDIVNTKE